MANDSQIALNDNGSTDKDPQVKNNDAEFKMDLPANVNE